MSKWEIPLKNGSDVDDDSTSVASTDFSEDRSSVASTEFDEDTASVEDDDMKIRVIDSSKGDSFSEESSRENMPRPGDVLLFKSEQTVGRISSDAAASLIMIGQTLAGVTGRYRDGSYDTTHFSICVGYTSTGIPLVAQFAGQTGGYDVSTLDKYLAGENRSYLIFSPKDHKKGSL